jgi:hypothetical protein
MLLPVHLDLGAAHAAARAAAAWTKVTGNGVHFPERLFVAGHPEEIIRQITAYRNAGCGEVGLSG